MTISSLLRRDRVAARARWRCPRPAVVALRHAALAGALGTLALALPLRSAAAQANQPPVAATTGPYTTTSLSLYIDGSPSSDPDGNPLTYAWDFGDGTTGKYYRVWKTYAARGTYTVTLVVTDSKGAKSAPVTTTVTIHNAPTAVAGGPYPAPEGSPVPFDGSASSDPDGDAIVGYAWDFGNGTTGSGARPAHSYAQSGSYTATLVVTDARGGTGRAQARAWISNVAPTVSMSLGTPAVAGNPVPLTGAVNDPSAADGPWTYTVVWGDGSSNTTGSVSSLGAPISAAHTYAAAGSYTVALQVRDKDGGQGTAQQSLTVGTGTVPTNNAPSAAPGGPYPGTEGSAVSLDGSASSDPDGDAIVGYAWNFGDGTTGSGAQPTHTYAQSGTYTVTLTVTDARGASSSPATATVTVANVAPTVSASLSETSVTTGTAVTLTGGFTDPSAVDGPWAYTIVWGDGTPNTTGSAASVGTAISATHTYAVAGRHIAALQVRDADGGEGTAQQPITVTEPSVPTNTAPTAAPGGPYSGTEGLAVSLDGSGSSDPDGHALTYAWDFGDGSSGTGAQPAHTYAQSGSYTVTLTVTDSEGASSSPATAAVTVANVAPTVSASLSASSVTTGSAVTLTSGFTDPSATDGPWTYTIVWGDGTPNTTGSAATVGTAISATHTYNTVGSYTVALQVTDKDGGQGTAQQPITVTLASSSNVVLLAGDIADCSRNTDEMTTAILDRYPGATIVTVGDNVYPYGTLATFNACYEPTWGRHKARTWPAVGNHEYTSAMPNAEGYHAYFGARAGPLGKAYYKTTIGDWDVFVLNSEISMTGNKPQDVWLREELANSTARCQLAVWHKPRYYSGTVSYERLNQKTTWTRLYDAGVELIFGGHQHWYERFAPMDPDGNVDLARGIRQFIVGTGGADPASMGTPAPNSELRETEAFGVLKLTLGSDSYTWEFLPAENTSFTDSGSGTCR